MKYNKHLYLLLWIIIHLNSSGQIPEEQPLYPDGIPGNPVIHAQPESYVDSTVMPGSLSGENRVFSYVSDPTYLLFPATDSSNLHIGLVIYPGGGLVNNWIDKEGTDLALWLSAKGITCMVVKYRTNQRDEKGKFLIPYDEYKGAIYQDARESILKMKSLSDSLDFDADRVGIAGFSAGAWLASRVALKYSEDQFPWKPDFIGIIYGGENVKALKQVKNKSALPPIFLAIARDDHKLPLYKVLDYFDVIISEVDRSELHIYAKGDHGFGLAYDNGHSVGLWRENFYSWMLDICDK